MAFLCLALILMGNAIVFADSQGSPAKGLPVPAHVFLRVQPKWIAVISYMKYIGEDQGFEGVQPVAHDPQIHDYYKEIRYFKTAQDVNDPNKACKIMTYDPQGHLESEIDQVRSDQYDRDFYPDHSLRDYMHWHDKEGAPYFGSQMDGFSISPTNKTVSHFSGGQGDLITWGKDGTTFDHRWYFHGNEYLKKEYSQAHCRKIMLHKPQYGDYVWTPYEETLHIEAAFEYWEKPNGKSPLRLGMGNGMPAMFFARRLPTDKKYKDAQIALLAQLTQEYAVSRVQFMNAYGRMLTHAGQSWKSLGLESIAGTHAGRQ